MFSYSLQPLLACQSLVPEAMAGQRPRGGLSRRRGGARVSAAQPAQLLAVLLTSEG